MTRGEGAAWEHGSKGEWVIVQCEGRRAQGVEKQNSGARIQIKDQCEVRGALCGKAKYPEARRKSGAESARHGAK